MIKQELIGCAIAALAIGAAAGMCWWTLAQWAECREAGMSAFYCLKHIS